jgi:hypothetical protein
MYPPQGNAAGVDVSDADAAVGEVLAPKTFYSVAAPRKTGTYSWTASATVRTNNPTQKFTYSYSWVKLKEIKLNGTFLGSIRINYQLHSGLPPEVAYGKLYRNAIAIGTQYTTTTTKDCSQTFSGIAWVANDLIQGYAKMGDGSTMRARLSDFQFCYDMYRATISTTNQDPA